MTATVREDRRGEGTERSFRYATLASGLDLVRTVAAPDVTHLKYARG